MSPAPHIAESHDYASVPEGAHFTRDYVATEEVYRGFLATFRDENPLHVDEDYARRAGQTGVVVHGAVINGFLSHFLGMHFPGKFGMLLSADVYYLKPTHIGDTLKFRITVAQKLDTHQVLVLSLSVENATRRYPAAKGKIQVKFLEATHG